MNKITIDHQFGIASEIRLLPVLQRYFNDDTIERIKNPRASFDYSGENKFIELKTRRCLSITYPDTIIPASKFKNIQPDINYYFVFKFTDKLLYCRYDPFHFSGFQQRENCILDRGRVEKQLYYHIPINFLKELIYEEPDSENDFVVEF